MVNTELDALLQNILTSSAIESEPLNQVRNRLLDGDLLADKPGFESGISAAQYQSLAKVSKATATLHLSDLLDKGCLQRLPGGERSTRYQVRWD